MQTDSMFRRLFLPLFILLAGGSAAFFLVTSLHHVFLPDSISSMIIGDSTIPVEVVDTPETRERGLSGTPSLPDDEGMLFVFERPGIYPFWMKDMNYSLDIIWINEASEIVDISENLSPLSYPNTFQSSSPAIYALEVNGGYAMSHNISVGEKVILK